MEPVKLALILGCLWAFLHLPIIYFLFRLLGLNAKLDHPLMLLTVLYTLSIIMMMVSFLFTSYYWYELWVRLGVFS